jgi:hypothetical protein
VLVVVVGAVVLVVGLGVVVVGAEVGVLVAGAGVVEMMVVVELSPHDANASAAIAPTTPTVKPIRNLCTTLSSCSIAGASLCTAPGPGDIRVTV